MSLKFDIRNDSLKTVASLQNIKQNINAKMRGAKHKIGNDLRRTLRGDMLDKKQGRFYTVTLQTGVTFTYQASAKGETPAFVSGNYAQNVRYTVTSSGITFGIDQNAVDYAARLEFGEGIGPRPGIANTVHKRESTIEQYIAEFAEKSFV